MLRWPNIIMFLILFPKCDCPASHDGVVYVPASDHSIRALSIKENGNPDEEWVHFTNEEDPVARDWVRSC